MVEANGVSASDVIKKENDHKDTNRPTSLWPTCWDTRDLYLYFLTWVCVTVAPKSETVLCLFLENFFSDFFFRNFFFRIFFSEFFFQNFFSEFLF